MARQRFLIGLLLLVIGIWFYFQMTSRPTVAPSMGPAPDIGIRTANGVVRLSDLKGKVVLIDFWATWCGPCRMSIPGVQRLYEKEHSRGFEVLGPALETDDGEKVAPFAKEMGMTYPIGMPAVREEVRPYKPESIPLMILIDKNGMIRARQEGYGPGVDEALAAQVEKLLTE